MVCLLILEWFCFYRYLSLYMYMYVLYVFFSFNFLAMFLSYLERNVFLKLNISWCKWAWDWQWNLWETLPQNQRTIVNNLGLPVFFMIIIFHNCTSNKWRDDIQCPVVFYLILNFKWLKKNVTYKCIFLFDLQNVFSSFCLVNVLNKAIVWWSVLIHIWFLYWSVSSF